MKNHAKKKTYRREKIFTTVIAYLSCLSLFSVGFSSFLIVNTNNTTATDNINVSVSPVEYNNCISLESFDIFTISGDGFERNNDGLLYNSGSINFNIRVNNDKANETGFITSGQMKIKADLQEVRTSSLLTSSQTVITCTDQVNIDNTFTTSGNPSSSYVNSIITFTTTTTGQKDITLTYTFNITDNAVFALYRDVPPTFNIKLEATL